MQCGKKFRHFGEPATSIFLYTDISLKLTDERIPVIFHSNLLCIPLGLNLLPNLSSRCRETGFSACSYRQEKMQKQQSSLAACVRAWRHDSRHCVARFTYKHQITLNNTTLYFCRFISTLFMTSGSTLFPPRCVSSPVALYSNPASNAVLTLFFTDIRSLQLNQCLVQNNSPYRYVFCPSSCIPWLPPISDHSHYSLTILIFFSSFFPSSFWFPQNYFLYVSIIRHSYELTNVF